MRESVGTRLPRLGDADAATVRSAQRRNRALCAGIDRDLAAMAGVRRQPPQPHVKWPVGRSGWICLRCSHYERG